MERSTASRVLSDLAREKPVNGIAFGAFLALAFVLSGARRNTVLKRMVGRTNDKLLHFATHDVLAGLPNRAMLTERIEHATPVARIGGDEFVVVMGNRASPVVGRAVVRTHTGAHCARMSISTAPYCG